VRGSPFSQRKVGGGKTFFSLEKKIMFITIILGYFWVTEGVEISQTLLKQAVFTKKNADFSPILLDFSTLYDF
jgi:hypothetical protein